MEDGWVQFQNLTKEHHVATLVDGHRIEYERPSEIHRFACENEKMYSLKSQLLHEVCTMNHKMYVKRRDHTEFELIEAQEVMGKRVSFKKDGVRECAEIPEMKITVGNETKTFNMDDWLDLVGIFIADGWVDKGAIQISGTKQRTYIANVCSRLGVEMTESVAPSKDVSSQYSVTINDKFVVAGLKPYSLGAINNVLPKYVFTLNQRQSRILLQSVVSCDEGYYTSSRNIAEDIAILAFHAGYSARITKMCDGELLCADTLNVRINKSENEPTNHGQEEIITYTGDVMCITVPSHVFYCREGPDSPPSWTGNSARSGQPTPLGPKQQATLPRGGAANAA